MNTKPASEVQKGDHVIIPQPYTTFLAPGGQAPVEVTAMIPAGGLLRMICVPPL